MFERMADVLVLLNANRFRVLAFQRAARALAEVTEDMSVLAREKDAMKQLTGAVRIGRPNDVHPEVQHFGHRQ